MTLSAEQIKEGREARRMSQSELAKQSGISTSLIASVENGARKVTPGTSDKVESVFKVTPIFGEKSTVSVAELSDESVSLTWKGNLLHKSEENIVRSLAKLLVDNRE